MKFAKICLLFFGLAGVMAAQQNTFNGQGYARFGFAGYERNFGDLYTVGVGGDGFIYRNLAAGATIDYINSFENAGTGAGLLSPSLSYHFVNRKDPAKVVPFVNGGYTLAFASGAAVNGFHYGGGATYWFKPKFGLRLEFRDHVIQSSHTYMLGIGFSFR